MRKGQNLRFRRQVDVFDFIHRFDYCIDYCGFWACTVHNTPEGSSLVGLLLLELSDTVVVYHRQSLKLQAPGPQPPLASFHNYNSEVRAPFPSSSYCSYLASCGLLALASGHRLVEVDNTHGANIIQKCFGYEQESLWLRRTKDPTSYVDG